MSVLLALLDRLGEPVFMQTFLGQSANQAAAEA